MERSIGVDCLDDELVAAYVDGALALSEIDRVDHHIDDCAHCRAQLSTVAASPHSFLDQHIGRITGSTPNLVEVVRETLAAGRPGDPLPATALGRYVIDEVIGRGGMGVVVRAHDPELERFIAIKLVHPAKSAWRAHVRDEARTMAKLRHPNVVTVYDAGSIGEQLFIAMELVDGTSLARSARSDRDLVHCIEAGRGVIAAHEVGIVHGDIKPDNILVGSDGRALIGDFGLARTIDADARGTGGTRGYLAPELERGGAPTVASDQYALAVTVYELLVGKKPVSLERPASVTRSLWTVIARGLAADPGDRYPSLRELVTALERATQPRRRVWPALALGAAILVGTGAAMWPSNAALGCVDPIDRALAIRPAECAGAACLPLAQRALAYRTTAVGICQATREGRQSTALLDARMGCLDQRLLEHAAVAREATSPGALAAIAHLDSPERCASFASTTAQLGPAQLIESGQARAWIAAAAAGNALGHYRQARDTLAAHLPQIQAIGQAAVTAEAAETLGDLDLTLGDLDGAEKTFDLGLRAASAGGEDAASARLLLRLAHEAGESRAQWDRCEELVRAAEAAVARAGNPRELQALLLTQKALVAEAHGDLDAAGTAYQQAAEMYRVDGPVMRYANALSLQCSFEARIDRIADARAHCTESIATFRQLLGADHPLVAEAETSLGIVDALAMHLEDARATWDRALARFDRSGGEDALGVATVLVDLLSVSTEQRDLAAADRYLARLQSLAATAETRPDNLGVQIRVAQLVALREPARGIALAEDLAKRSDAALGRNSRTSASAYESLGYMYSDAKRFADAKTAFERTVEASRALYGERNPTTIDTEERFNQLLVETGDLATARPNLERLELALEQTQPKDSAKLANAELNLADCMLRQNDLAKAEDFARRSLAIRETRGDDPLQTSEARFLLAQVIWKARKEPTAIAFATKARDEMKAIGPRASTLPDVEQFLKQARAR